MSNAAPNNTAPDNAAKSSYEKAMTPEDLARFFVERANAGDADGLAALYEPDAVLAFPPGARTVGRDAIREVCAALVADGPTFTLEDPLPTVVNGDLALTSTRPTDGTGGRVQLVRRQPDGSWLRVIDRPES
ncbi:YybH family protein [Actinokineospora bangkokensis]|uniref:DUF4440 domain-containing protein n=1 Tax=Actinokineospora bangkokensis TaxID=1193682 RepID=A0A1Q9LT06_9PSEU|nr:nuclear transport factor 2 family protein [Actinokineospora bangkokensis]OLR95131.1 DUF4440 domain-containing protein [Actinokineospora bangkokensis]